MNLAQALVAEHLLPYIPSLWEQHSVTKGAIRWDPKNYCVKDPSVIILESGAIDVWDRKTFNWKRVTIKKAIAYLKKVK